MIFYRRWFSGKLKVHLIKSCKSFLVEDQSVYLIQDTLSAGS